ncbi:MAG: preprotein translocase subunit SecG [Rhodospirillaceae bacterium]
MTTVILLVHVLLALGLVVLVLLQRSEGGALGIGGGAMDGLMSVRGAGNMLTKWTGILAGCFIATSLMLAIIAGNGQSKRSIVDQPNKGSQPIVPSVPSKPIVPVGK